MRAGTAAPADNHGTAEPTSAAASSAEPDPAGPLPSREEMVLAWGDSILAGLPNKVRVLFQTGRFLANDANAAVFALPNKIHLGRCEETRGDVDAALQSHFGRPVRLRLTIDDNSTAPPPDLEATTAPTPDTEVTPPRSARDDHDDRETADPEPPRNDEVATQETLSNLMAAFPDAELVTLDPPTASGR